jgi:hypothetical protein
MTAGVRTRRRTHPACRTMTAPNPLVIARLVRNCALGGRPGIPESEGRGALDTPHEREKTVVYVALKKMKFLSRHKHIASSGKSVLIIGIRVKPLKQKYFASHFGKSEL